MKVVVVLLASMAVVAYASPQKRFFIKDINNLVDKLKHAFDSAKDQFNKIASGLHVHFDKVVDVLIDQIDSGMTKGACKLVCEKSATQVLGDAAPMATQLCGPACQAALAKLEEVAG